MAGILQPILAHRFRVLFEVELGGSNKVDPVLTQQIANVAMNLQKKELRLSIRESADPKVFLAANKLALLAPTVIIVEPMQHSSNPLWGANFHGCKCVDHNLSFDYSGSEVAAHQFTFSYSWVDLREPIDLKEYAEDLPMAEGDLTPSEAVDKIVKGNEGEAR